MRLHYYCDSCGSELVLQDSIWLGHRYTVCPICGDDTGAFVELVPEKIKEDNDEESDE
jgi:hypothetical protein